jgi:pSer/pThr/pTyr-binding forkhead associated (FHA) protein
MPQDDLKPQASWLIGSAKDCDLRVAKETVSGHHCRLVQLANGFTLEDLGSTNGTHISGVRLAPGQPIRIAYGTPV